MRVNKILICLILIVVLGGCGCSKNVKKIDLNKTKNITVDDLEITIANDFEKVSSNDNSSDTEYSLRESDNKNNCALIIDKIDSSTIENIDSYLLELVYLDEEDIDLVKTKTINNHTWKYISIDDNESFKHYIYITEENNKVYVVTYNMLNSETLCQDAFNKMLDSFEFKN